MAKNNFMNKILNTRQHMNAEPNVASWLIFQMIRLSKRASVHTVLKDWNLSVSQMQWKCCHIMTIKIKSCYSAIYSQWQGYFKKKIISSKASGSSPTLEVSMQNRKFWLLSTADIVSKEQFCYPWLCKSSKLWESDFTHIQPACLGQNVAY